MLMAWTEGTAWAKGGAVAWQLLDPNGKAVDKGRTDGLPAWSLATAYTRPDNTFVIVY
jgi:hypothetical protein